MYSPMYPPPPPAPTPFQGTQPSPFQPAPMYFPYVFALCIPLCISSYVLPLCIPQPPPAPTPFQGTQPSPFQPSPFSLKNVET